MKKIGLYIMMLLATCFVGCDEDFDDWAKPQGYPQEEAIQGDFLIDNLAAGGFDLAEVTEDSVAIAQIAALPDVGANASIDYELVLADFGSVGASVAKSVRSTLKTVVLPYGIDEDRIMVATADLEDGVWELIGKAEQERSMGVYVNILIGFESGQVSKIESEAPVTFPVQTQKLPIESDYYLIGDPTGWDQDNPLQFSANGDGKFELIFITTKEKSNVKIIPQSGVDAGGDDFWAFALGAKTDGDNATTGSLYAKKGDREPGAILVEGEGKKKISLDMNDYSYVVEDYVETMYINGTPWGWSWEEVGESMTLVNGVEGKFWSVNYFGANAQIKFCSKKAWNGDFGFGGTNFPQESIDRAGLSDEGNNIGIANAGWYIVVVTTEADGSYTVEFLEPNIWLVGPTSTGGWDNIAGNEANLFTVPVDGAGEFVSPEFLVSDNVRMCVKLENVDWWRSEFVILDGKIAYRGNGGDQEEVAVNAGEKAYLKFSDGTGRIE